jgi:hypothetical protein
MVQRLKLKSKHSGVRRNDAAAQTPPVTSSDADVPIWGAAKIGAIVGLTERQAYHLLESKMLRGAKRIGGKWSAIPSVLLRAWESGEA